MRRVIRDDDLPARIRTHRKAKGLTQQRLARMVGVGLQTIACYEGGRMRPSMQVLARLAAVLNMPLDGIDIDGARPNKPPRRATDSKAR